jgi:hypothetical protein
MRLELLDRRVQWTKAINLWHNALIRTTLYTPVTVIHKITGKSR